MPSPVPSSPPLDWVRGRPLAVTTDLFRRFTRSVVAAHPHGCPEAVERLLADAKRVGEIIAHHRGYAWIDGRSIVCIECRPPTDRTPGLNPVGNRSAFGFALSDLERAGSRLFVRIRSDQYARSLVVLSPRYRGSRRATD